MVLLQQAKMNTEMDKTTKQSANDKSISRINAMPEEP